MKKKFLLPLLLLVVSLTACTLLSTPEKTVTEFFKYLKKADYENAHKFLSRSVFDNAPNAEKELLGVYFGTMKISNLKVTEKTNSLATVSFDITATDIFQIVQDFMMNMAEKLEDEGLSVDNVTDDQLDVILKKELQAKNAPQKSMTATLKLAKNNKKWLIDADNSLLSTLFLQDFNNESMYHEEDGYGYSVFDTVDTKAIFTGADEMMGLCSFNVEGESYQMFCEPNQMEELEANYAGKEVEIVYQALRSNTAENAEDEEAATIYILESIK